MCSSNTLRASVPKSRFCWYVLLQVERNGGVLEWYKMTQQDSLY